MAITTHQGRDYALLIHAAHKRQTRRAAVHRLTERVRHLGRRHGATIRYVASEALAGLAFVAFLAFVLGVYTLAWV
jgi:hypothetical protein